MAREAQNFCRQFEQLLHRQVISTQARLQQAFRPNLSPIPPVMPFGNQIQGGQRKPQCLANIPDGRLGPVADDGGGQGGPVPAIFGVQVLDHLFAPFMLKVDVNIGRLIALPADETLEQHTHAGRVYLGDAQAIADDAVGCGPSTLAQDVL